MTTRRTWPFVGRDDVLDRLVASMTDPDTNAVVVTAPAGAGKTRLAREAAASLAVPPLWWQASPAAAGVPLGVLAAVLDAGHADAAVVYQRLVALARDAGGVIVVDDAPHLDASSADLLHRLVDAGEVTVVATARAGEAVPRWMEWLWLGEQTTHLDLDPLDEDATRALVEIVLPEADASQRTTLARGLADRTRGNALFLRELLVDLQRGIEAGRPPTIDADAPAHLLRVLEARQLAAGHPVREVLRDVAVAGSLPACLLEQRHDPATVDAAEREGYVTISDGDAPARPTARPAHPLHAEAALGSLTAGERRRRTVEIADAVLGEPSATVAERLAAATALVDADARIDVDDVVEAARVAFAALDHGLAIRLATAAIAAGDRFEARVVLGAALSGADRSAEAEVALREALAAASTDDERVRAAGRISVHLVAHGGRVDDAALLLEEVDAVVVDPAARTFLAADRAKLASFRGDLASIAPIDDEEADELTVLNGAIVGAYAQAMAGDAERCRATIARALPLADAHRAVLPWSAELVRFSGPFAALVSEGPEGARAEASAGLDRAQRTSEPTAGTWRFLAGFSAAVSGHLAAAATDLQQASADLAGHDLIGARPLAIAAGGWAAAQAGDVAAARDHLDAALDAAALDARVRTQVAVADAWCDVIEGGTVTDAAASKIVDAALEAAEGGQVVIAVIVLHELVRLGDPHRAADALGRATRSAPTSWLIQFARERAAAEAAGDDAALARLVRRAEGRWPAAVAELHASRSRRARARGDDVLAARSAFDARRAVDGLGPLVPWQLRGIESPLTAREAEVVAAVARGASNREVAEGAGVSVRTVENQLQSAYRKLGLAGRADLGGLFGG